MRSRYFAAGQTNIIFQANPPFHSPYEGTNSFVGTGRVQDVACGDAVSWGRRLPQRRATTRRCCSTLNRVAAAGCRRRLGWRDLRTWTWCGIRTWGPSPTWRACRCTETIGLSGKLVDASGRRFSLSTQVPEKRLELRVGKMSLPDFLDQNSWGQRQPSAVYELDDRQPGCVGLRGGHARVHVGRAGGAGHGELLRALRACDDADDCERDRRGFCPATGQRAERGTGIATARVRHVANDGTPAGFCEPRQHGDVPRGEPDGACRRHRAGRDRDTQARAR